MSRRRLLVPLFALVLCLPSCFTTALWSTDAGDAGDSGFTANEILTRALLTPIAVCLDLVTLCAQAAIFGDDDDDGGDRVCARPRPCGSHGHR